MLVKRIKSSETALLLRHRPPLMCFID